MAPTRILLMSCGSYNPPTNMHLRMFEIARDHLHRMGTHVVVGGVISPVHDSYGKKELANAEHRVAMIYASLQNTEWIKVSTWETRQNTWSKTKTSLTYHQNLLNSVLQNPIDVVRNHVDVHDLEWIPENIKNGTDKTPIQIKLLCGGDFLESFGIPNLWAEEDIDTIVGQHGLVVITREGSNPNKFIYDSDLLSRHMHNIYIVTEWICNEVSSTKIRRALKRGESVKYLIQDAVIDYINNFGLYDVKTSSTTTMTKLTLSSTNSNNYLHIDTKYNSAFLTPSPSDIIMASPSPVEIISIDIAESLIQKNIKNSPGLHVVNNAENTERMREKFMNAISENGNRVASLPTSKSSYPGQAKQIIATEAGASLILREVGSHDETSTSVECNVIDGTESDIKNSTEYEVNDDNTTIHVEEIDGSVSSLLLVSENNITEQSNFNTKLTSDDFMDSEVVKSLEFIIEDRDEKITRVQHLEVTATISPPPSVPEAEEMLNMEDDKNEKVKVETKTEKLIDDEKKDSNSKEYNISGNHLKSMVSLRRGPNRSNNLSEQVVPMMDSECKSRVNNEKIDNVGKSDDVQILERSKSDKESSSRKNFQGSLESINSRKPKTLSKKSKSFEYIKGDMLIKEIKQIDISDKCSERKSSSPTVVQSSVKLTEITNVDNQPIDEFCSVCCYNKDQSSSKKLYTLHSNNSSPVDVESPECEICSSCNFQNNESVTTELQCELCEICGDIAMDMDVVASSRPESEELLEARILSTSRHLPLNMKKRKLSSCVKMDGRIFDIADEDADCEDNGEVQIEAAEKAERPPSTSIEEYSDDSTLDDVEFEIENCGLDVETTQSAIIISAKQEVSDVKETDEFCNIDDNNTDTKRMTRGSSLINRTVSKPDTKKRYSSVDNLPTSQKTVKSISKMPIEVIKDQIRIAGSVDNIRIAKKSKSPSRFRKSADDVGKSIKEEAKLEESKKQLSLPSEKTSRVGPDTIKFIIGKHGLKIVSDRETAL